MNELINSASNNEKQKPKEQFEQETEDFFNYSANQNKNSTNN